MVSPRADSFRAVALVPDMLTSVRIENAVLRAGGALDIVYTDTELFAALSGRPRSPSSTSGCPGWTSMPSPSAARKRASR